MNRSRKLEIAEELAYLGELIVQQVELDPTKESVADPNQLLVGAIRALMEYRLQMVRELAGGSASFNDPLWRLDTCVTKLQTIEESLRPAEVG